MKASKKVTYAYPAEPGQKPDGFGRMHWVMRWWGRVGVRMDEPGWRGQHFSTNMDERVAEHKRRHENPTAGLRNQLIVVLSSEDEFQKMTGSR